MRDSVVVYESDSHTKRRPEAAALRRHRRERRSAGYDNTLVTVNVGKNAIKVVRPSGRRRDGVRVVERDCLSSSVVTTLYRQESHVANTAPTAAQHRACSGSH